MKHYLLIQLALLSSKGLCNSFPRNEDTGLFFGSNFSFSFEIESLNHLSDGYIRMNCSFVPNFFASNLFFIGDGDARAVR